MKANSMHSNSIKINPHIKTAIIYSIEHLFSYIVEIKSDDKSYYISNEGEPLTFGNMEDARQAALKENAEEAYLALSKTSAETDLNSTHDSNRYDYSFIPLHPES